MKAFATQSRVQSPFYLQFDETKYNEIFWSTHQVFTSTNFSWRIGTCSKSICSDPVSASPLNISNLQQNHLHLIQFQLLFCHLQLYYLQQVTCSRLFAANRTLTANQDTCRKNRTLAAIIYSKLDHLERPFAGK